MPQPSLRFRAATQADAEGLFELMVALADHQGHRQFLKTSAASLRRDGLVPGSHFGAFVAEAQGRLVGYASYMWHYSIWAGETYITLDDVYVAPAYRSQGVGVGLMREIRDVCVARGVRKIRWEVESSDSRAIQFYERLGAKMRPKGVFVWDI